MVWVWVGYNGDGGFKKVRVGVDRVPVEGERFEFRDPDGGASDWPKDLDGGKFRVSEVTYIAPGERASATTVVFVEPD